MNSNNVCAPNDDTLTRFYECQIQEECSGSVEDKLIIKLVGYLNSRDVVSVGPDGAGGVSVGPDGAWGEHGGERGAFSVEQKDTILYYEVPLTSLDGLVGQHSFPFSVRLPEVLPPSVEVRTEPTHFLVEVDVEDDHRHVPNIRMSVLFCMCPVLALRKKEDLSTPRDTVLFVALTAA